MVDILCAALSGGPTGSDVRDTATSSARVSHFFGAIRIDTFREPRAFRADMDSMLQKLRATTTAEDAERVWFAGEKEFEHERETRRCGVPLSNATYASLCEIGREMDVAGPAIVEGRKISV